jgi:hypothetical protein
VLAGDAITNSPYQLEMKVPKSCQKLCRQEYSDKQMKMFRHLIDEEYRVHWCVRRLVSLSRGRLSWGLLLGGWLVTCLELAGWAEPAGRQALHSS